MWFFNILAFQWDISRQSVLCAKLCAFIVGRTRSTIIEDDSKTKTNNFVDYVVLCLWSNQLTASTNWLCLWVCHSFQGSSLFPFPSLLFSSIYFKIIYLQLEFCHSFVNFRNCLYIIDKIEIMRILEKFALINYQIWVMICKNLCADLIALQATRIRGKFRRKSPVYSFHAIRICNI